MVTRKPVGPPISTTQAAAAAADSSAPPYPTTPAVQSASSVYSDDLKNSPAFNLIDVHDARQTARRDSDVSSHGTWDSDGTEQEDENEHQHHAQGHHHGTPEDAVEIPQPLNVRNSQSNIKAEAKPHESQDMLPAALRPGPVNGVVVGSRAPGSRQYEAEAQANPWALESNNPYLSKTQQTAPNNTHVEITPKIWEQAARQPQSQPPQPIQAPPMPPQASPPPPPVELPSEHAPVDEVARMSLASRKLSDPYKTAEVLPVPQLGQHPLPPVTKADLNAPQPFPPTNPWSEMEQSPNLPPLAPPKESLSPHRPSQPEKTEFASTSPQHLPPFRPAEAEYAAPPGPPPGMAGPLIDHEESVPRPQPPPVSTQKSGMSLKPNDSGLETPGTRDRRTRNEHYQIKHINWFDSALGKAGMRQSPILTQNENGPCPLLALVNALVLSTPPNMDTALVETLRTREQVSLGLLLDAVFDELMSGRRGETAFQLPDVTELYQFLLALHTGMNVNPKFITPAMTPRGSLDGHPAALHGIHPSERSQSKPGCFEETKEMRLYSTFNIPLIHGWTAPKDTPAYMAFMRQAQTFEAAQNIQFEEFDLEEKLRSQGLNFEEQQKLEDVHTIKSFLQTWPTQLTDHGLQTIAGSLNSGQIAILFRNDHFSMLYKEPRHGALMTLVTDAGYGSHDEIVWESLADVNGAASQMFSGDFQLVSHGDDPRLNQDSSASGSEELQGVQSRSRYHRTPSSNPIGSAALASLPAENPPALPGPRPTSSRASELQDASRGGRQLTATEQEDHDLALALQLQEEEEDHQRQVEERRRREQELSERFLSNEEQPPAVPPRRQGQGAHSNRQSGTHNIPISSPTNSSDRRHATSSTAPQVRPGVNRPSTSNDPDAPPTYEQSASDRPYRPAGATAPPSQGNPLNTLDALRRQQGGQQSAYAQQSSTSVNTQGLPSQHNRRTSQPGRAQRRSSQYGAPSYPGMAGGTNSGPGGRVVQAATVKDTDERCIIM